MVRIAAALLGLALTACGASAPPGPAPTVVATIPAQGAADVDPALAEIRVAFSAPMQPMGWALTREAADTFPRITAQPRQTDTLDAFMIPVALEPGRTYVIWLNGQGRRDFRDREGRPAEPFRLEFRTAPR